MSRSRTKPLVVLIDEGLADARSQPEKTLMDVRSRIGQDRPIEDVRRDLHLVCAALDQATAELRNRDKAVSIVVAYYEDRLAKEAP